MAKILAVDDEEQALENILRAFRSTGHQVTAATSGAAALQLMRTETFDVAVVDYRMEPPNGLEVLLALRDAQPRCVRVLMSGALELPVVISAVNRGEVARLIEKPFKISELVATLDEALNARKRVEEIERRAEEAHLERAEGHLRECISKNLIQLALQPIVRASDSAVFAQEALLRSSHPVLDNVLDVLTVAEQRNLVPELTQVVANCAARVIEKLPADQLLFMNLHPVEFGEPARLSETLSELHPHAKRVVIEITERRSVLELERWRSSVSLLGQLGYSLAVDDLGAGYSSLLVLAEIEPRFMKVDMSIIRGIHRDPRKRRLIELLCRFAEATDSKLIAEGVEKNEEAEVLRAAGVHYLQGYFFGRPTIMK